MATDSNWGRLIKSICDKVSCHGVGKPVAGLINEVNGVEDETITLLRNISRDVEMIKNGPYHAGMEWFRMSEFPHYTDAERDEALREGRVCFINALGNNKGDDLISAMIGLQLGLCSLARGKHDDARIHLGEAYDAAVRSLEASCEGFNQAMIRGVFSKRTLCCAIGAAAILATGGMGIPFALGAAPTFGVAAGAFKGDSNKKASLKQAQAAAPVVNGLGTLLNIVDPLPDGKPSRFTDVSPVVLRDVELVLK